MRSLYIRCWPTHTKHLCRTSENRGKLINAGAMVYDLVGAVVEGLQQLSYNVAIENPAFDSMMRTLARVLHVAPLASLHSPIIGGLPQLTST